MAAAASGSPGRAAAWTAAGAVLCLVLALVWVRVLDRVVERGPTAARTPRQAAARRERRTLLRPGPVHALLRKDVRYLFGEPALRLGLVSQAFFAVVVLLAVGSAMPRGGAVWLVAAVAPLGALYLVSLLGADRAASWTLLAAGVDWRDVVLAKVGATAVWAVPVQVLLTTVTAAATGGLDRLAPALLLGLGVLATALGSASVAAVLVPVPLPVPRPGSGLFAARTGGGAGASLTQSLATLLALVPALPPAAGALLAGVYSGPRGVLLACAGALLYGLVLLGVGVALATRRARGHGPEIVAALSRG